MLIKSISGIRGTIGGTVGECLTPPDIVRFATGYGAWILSKIEAVNSNAPTVVLGRDARMSGRMVSDLISAT